MATLQSKTPEGLFKRIKPEADYTVKRAGASYNDNIDINEAVNKAGKPTAVTVNHPPVGSYKGYKWQSVRLPSKWQRYKNPYDQSKALVNEEDVKNKTIERWKKLPDELRHEVDVALGMELDPFDFSEEDAVETTLDEDIDYFNSGYFQPEDWEAVDRVLKKYGY